MSIKVMKESVVTARHRLKMTKLSSVPAVYLLLTNSR